MNKKDDKPTVHGIHQENRGQLMVVVGGCSRLTSPKGRATDFEGSRVRGRAAATSGAWRPPTLKAVAFYGKD